MELLEFNNVISKLKMHCLAISWLDTAEGKISELEDILIENTQVLAQEKIQKASVTEDTTNGLMYL
jgi:hypothetical protein